MSTSVNDESILVCVICNLTAGFECPCDTGLYYCSEICQLKSWYDLNHELECSTNPHRKRRLPESTEDDPSTHLHSEKRTRPETGAQGQTQYAQASAREIRTNGVSDRAKSVDHTAIESVVTSAGDRTQCVNRDAEAKRSQFTTGGVSGRKPQTGPKVRRDTHSTSTCEIEQWIETGATQATRKCEIEEWIETGKTRPIGGALRPKDDPREKLYSCYRIGCTSRCQKRSDLYIHMTNCVRTRTTRLFQCPYETCTYRDYESLVALERHMFFKHRKDITQQDCECGCMKKLTPISRQMHHTLMHPDEKTSAAHSEQDSHRRRSENGSMRMKADNSRGQGGSGITVAVKDVAPLPAQESNAGSNKGVVASGKQKAIEPDKQSRNGHELQSTNTTSNIARSDAQNKEYQDQSVVARTRRETHKGVESSQKESLQKSIHKCSRPGCNAQFTSRKDLDDHQRYHVTLNADKPFYCPKKLCDHDNFAKFSELKMHIMQVHGDETKEGLAKMTHKVASQSLTPGTVTWPQKCVIGTCGVVLHDKSAAQKHRYAVHDAGICTWIGCGQVYTGSFYAHYNEIHSVDPTQCRFASECHYKLTVTADGVQKEMEHYSKHYGILVCPLCDARYPSKKRLNKHILLHKP